MLYFINPFKSTNVKIAVKNKIISLCDTRYLYWNCAIGYIDILYYYYIVDEKPMICNQEPFIVLSDSKIYNYIINDKFKIYPYITNIELLTQMSLNVAYNNYNMFYEPYNVTIHNKYYGIY